MKRMMLTWSLILLSLAIPSLSLKANDDVSAQQNSGAVADRLAIRELIESYNAAVIEKNPAKWIANWTEDGVWNLGGGDIEGKTAFSNRGSPLWRLTNTPLCLPNPFLFKPTGKKAQRSGTRMNDLNCIAAMRCWPSGVIKIATCAPMECGK